MGIKWNGKQLGGGTKMKQLSGFFYVHTKAFFFFFTLLWGVLRRLESTIKRGSARGFALTSQLISGGREPLTGTLVHGRARITSLVHIHRY